MAYAPVAVRREGRRVTIEIDLPEQGEPSLRGRAENLVDPNAWIDEGDLALKLTLCRPYRRGQRSWPGRTPPRSTRASWGAHDAESVR
jgi:hypothetical protein